MITSDFATRVRWWGRALFVITLIVYSVTLSPGFFPGLSANHVASHLGVHPFPPTMHHVWGWLIAAVAAIPIGPLAIRIHIVGAVCAATSVWLLFQIMARLKRERKFEEGMPRGDAERVCLFTALFAAAALAIAPPFWMAATRAHPLSLSLTLMLAAFYLIFRYGEEGGSRRLYMSVLAYGIGMANYASLLLYLPIYVLLTLVSVYRQGQLRWVMLLKLAATGLAGAIPILIAAAIYRFSEAYTWRDFSHYGQVLWYMLLDQYQFVLRAVPRVGWLTVGVVSVLPWVAVFVLGISRRSISTGPLFGGAIISLLLTALAVVVFLDIKISPWALTGDQPLLISPYVLVAMWTASIAGYWLAMCRPYRASLNRAIAMVWTCVAFGFLGFVAVRNFTIAGGTEGRWFARYAKEAVDRIGDRPFLLSSGPFDDLLLLEARARGRRLDAINLRHAQLLAYRRYVASLFDEPRYKSLALVNLQPFIFEWFSRETNIARQVAVIDLADVWMAARRIPEPRGLLYEGRVPENPMDVEALASDNRAFWNSFAIPASQRVRPERHPAAIALRGMLAQSAKAANNLGVLWEEAGDYEKAEEAYRHAHRFNPNNISALVNLHALLKRQERDEAQAIEDLIEQRISRGDVRRQLWALSYHHGIIRSPELYASRGWAWAMSGKPALAAENIRQAIDLGGESAALRFALAALDASQEGAFDAEEALLAEMERDPSNRSAAIGLYHIALRRGQFDVARGRLEILRNLKFDPMYIETEKAILLALSGDAARASEVLADIVRRAPDNLRAWAALAVVAGERQDSKTVREALDQLQQARRASPAVRFLAAQIALREGDRDGARRQLEQILRQEPRHSPAIELMIRLLMMAGDREGAEAWLDRLIAIDPRHPYGNYLLGAVQAMRGQYQLAESSYRVSLESRRSPEALNDLAYVLTRMNRAAEALPLIEECLRQSHLDGAAWNTYGVVLLALGRYAEAEEAFQKALAARPDVAEVQLNLARVLERTGRRAEALKLAESLISRSGELLRDDQDGLRDLLQRLRSG
jgi:tetratricopeptide (TPR) repeat protein